MAVTIADIIASSPPIGPPDISLSSTTTLNKPWPSLLSPANSENAFGSTLAAPLALVSLQDTLTVERQENFYIKLEKERAAAAAASS
ncbi:hypothetical protein JR316_0007950 [Psilocybe cubensis]|uniref:Uncharacterized protein n=1 Tax=Psilocybe cubensis TaxID=181762 RepID=A0ACB8GWL3_PSICU|nr:hypothetical protein JR316_0007950 [Psilocybe cubensis]KAH9479360.1 hypothetical protein JR316_0007950 [Psilocybe cubensis]